MLYTVDRASSLVEGMTLSLFQYTDVTPLELQAHLDELFPSGVTLHGEKYLVDASSSSRITSPAIELVWESIRRAHYPHAPSRFQSLFASSSLDQAQLFRAQFGQNAPIYEVAAEANFRADMNALHSGSSALFTSYLAQRYWRQEPGSAEPFWEYLLTPPVTVGRQVG